jgi:hypothetical protein
VANIPDSERKEVGKMASMALKSLLDSSGSNFDKLISQIKKEI